MPECTAHRFNGNGRDQFILWGEKLVAGVVGRVGVDSVAPPGLVITLGLAATVSAKVVHVDGVGPLGVDGSVVVESALM